MPKLATAAMAGIVAWIITQAMFTRRPALAATAPPTTAADANTFEAPRAGPAMWRRCAAFLDAARKSALNLAALLATGFVAWVIVHEMLAGGYEVLSIEVPSNLAARLSGEEVSAAIRDGMATDWRKAANSSPISAIPNDKDEPAITIGGSNVSLKYVAKLLRRELHHPVVEIGGRMIEIVVPSEAAASAGNAKRPSPSIDAGEARALTVRLTLSDVAGDRPPFFDEQGRYDDVIQDAALASLEQVDSFAAVLAGSQGTTSQKLEALRLAKTTLANSKSSPGLGKALLAEATAFIGLGRWDQAEGYLGRAVNALHGSTEDRSLLAVAQDGLAIAYIVNRDWPKARQAVSEALAENSHYDSALYHQIEVDDEISRAYFGVGPDGKGDACQAEGSYWTAVEGYTNFYDAHPRFSIAYTMYATMRLIRLHWMRSKHPVLSCVGTPHIEALQDDEKDTRDAFEQAITEDANDYTAWFQYANFLFEAQDPQYVDSEKDPDKRRNMLDDAEQAYQRSLSLEPSDFYVWYRFAETLSQDLAFSPKLALRLAPQAIAAYCRSIALNRRDPGLVLDARTKVEKLSGSCQTESGLLPDPSPPSPPLLGASPQRDGRIRIEGERRRIAQVAGGQADVAQLVRVEPGELVQQRPRPIDLHRPFRRAAQCRRDHCRPAAPRRAETPRLNRHRPIS